MTNREKGPGWGWPVLLGLVILALWLISGVMIANFVGDPGRFGDMFGAINPLFSGLAFAGVIYAILLQRFELGLQRDELELTRGELAGQKEQLKVQNKTLRQQTFENTFFQLLRLHNDIVGAIDLRRESDQEVTAVGRDCFKVFYERFRKRWRKSPAAGGSERERINNAYVAFYPGVEAELGHYFRSLYNIVKFIDGSVVDDKRLYTNLVRAQLPSWVLVTAGKWTAKPQYRADPTLQVSETTNDS